MFTLPLMITWPILERPSLVTSVLVSPVELNVGAAGLATQGEEEKAREGGILGTHWRRDGGLINRNSTILQNQPCWTSGNHRPIITMSCHGGGNAEPQREENDKDMDPKIPSQHGLEWQTIENTLPQQYFVSKPGKGIVNCHVNNVDQKGSIPTLQAVP